MLDYRSFIAFLNKKRYHMHQYEDGIVVYLHDFSWAMCRVYLSDGMIISFCWEHLIDSDYKQFLSLFTTEPLFRFSEAGSVKVFTLITGIKDE